MSRSRKGSSRAGSDIDDDAAEAAAERAAKLDAVRRAMMEELGIGRVESLRKLRTQHTTAHFFPPLSWKHY